jgi:hypothetical protein
MELKDIFDSYRASLEIMAESILSIFYGLKIKGNGMPSKTKKQARLMAAAAHNPEIAKKVGVKQSVAKEFNESDAGTGILKGKKKNKGKLNAKT